MAERFYIEHAPMGATIELQKDEAHHLLRVRRVRPGDEVVIFDGSGTDYFGVVSEAGKSKVVIQVTRTELAAREPKIHTTLAIAVLKQAGMDSLIDMATQLGVKRIIPVITEHCVAHPKEKKADRWHRIAIEACKQCGRSVIPQIEPVQDFADFIADMSQYIGNPPQSKIQNQSRDVNPAQSKIQNLKSKIAEAEVPEVEKKFNYDFAGIMSLRPGTRPLIDALPAKLSKALILIGPEGDFTDSEMDAAISAGCSPVTLGRCVLRAETAAAAALAVIMQRDVQSI